MYGNLYHWHYHGKHSQIHFFYHYLVLSKAQESGKGRRFFSILYKLYNSARHYIQNASSLYQPIKKSDTQTSVHSPQHVGGRPPFYARCTIPLHIMYKLHLHCIIQDFDWLTFLHSLLHIIYKYDQTSDQT